MMRADREARLQRAKAIGRIAYRIVRASKIEGFLDFKDGRKRHRKSDRGALSIALYESAHVDPHGGDFSQLCIRHAGRKVLDIRWNSGGVFKIAKFEPGDWRERFLRA